MARKTVSVEAMRENSNILLANTARCFDESFRLGVIAMTESILFSTGNYKGFRYLSSEFEDLKIGDHETRVLRVGYDDTRREYL